MVSTLDFESTDPSSNLGGTFHFTAHQSEHTLLCQSCLTWYMVNLHLLVSVHWNLKCRSEMITSQWGDQKLWIRHDDEAKDLVLKPKWNQFTPQFGPTLKMTQRNLQNAHTIAMFDLKEIIEVSPTFFSGHIGRYVFGPLWLVKVCCPFVNPVPIWYFNLVNLKIFIIQKSAKFNFLSF